MNIVQTDFFGNDVTYRAQRKATGTEGQRRKKAGMKRVLKNAGDEWKQAAIAKIHDWKHAHRHERAFRSIRKRHAFEDIKQWCIENGLREPHNANAWGALSRAAVKAGAIRDTGEFAMAKLPKAHGRAVRLYEIA